MSSTSITCSRFASQAHAAKNLETKGCSLAEAVLEIAVRSQVVKRKEDAAHPEKLERQLAEAHARFAAALRAVPLRASEQGKPSFSAAGRGASQPYRL